MSMSIATYTFKSNQWMIRIYEWSKSKLLLFRNSMKSRNLFKWNSITSRSISKSHRIIYTKQFFYMSYMLIRDKTILTYWSNDLFAIFRYTTSFHRFQGDWSFEFYFKFMENVSFKWYHFFLLPSQYSITGISPQRYLWRIVIALHIWPRLVISFVHKNHLNHHILNKVSNLNQLSSAMRLAKILHYLSLIEIAALAGVTYVSNKENYRKCFFEIFWVHFLTVVTHFHSYAWEDLYHLHDNFD